MLAEVGFSEYVEEWRQTDADLSGIVRLRTPESTVATADVRLKGAMVLHCVLESDQSGPATVLTSTANTFEQYSVSKLGATHPMSPVGSYEGPGGQHGPLRWMQYEETEPGSLSVVSLVAKHPDWPIRATRIVGLLNQSTIGIATFITNRTLDVNNTSLGEHAYFAMPEPPQNAGELLVNGKSLDHPSIGGGGAFDAVMAGKAIFWQGFEHSADITFPNGMPVRIIADYDRSSGARSNPGMLIWHRPETQTVCFEPVIGCRPGETPQDPPSSNQALRIGPGQGALLRTAIKLL